MDQPVDQPEQKTEQHASSGTNKAERCWLPGFRNTCLIVSVLDVLLAAGVLLRGIRPSMAQFGVPQAVLDSPHYTDAIFWVYSHMLVIGLIIGVLGWYAESPALRQAMARLLLAAHLFYTVLDFRASDSLLGNGLYQGPASLIPAFISLFMTVLFAHLSFCKQH